MSPPEPGCCRDNMGTNRRYFAPVSILSSQYICEHVKGTTTLLELLLKSGKQEYLQSTGYLQFCAVLTVLCCTATRASNEDYLKVHEDFIIMDMVPTRFSFMCMVS